MSVQTLCKVPPYPDRPKPAGSRRPRRAGRVFVLATPVLVLVCTTTWLATPAAHHAQRPDLLTQPVHYDRLQVSYTEHGVVMAALNSDIVCRVKARNHGSTVATTIKWVIDDGTPVHKGEAVALLDDSAIQEDMKTQHMALLQAQSDWIQAEANCKIIDIQNQADIQTARVTLELAEVDIADSEPGQLGDPQPGLGGEYQQGVVAASVPGGAVGGG